MSKVWLVHYVFRSIEENKSSLQLYNEIVILIVISIYIGLMVYSYDEFKNATGNFVQTNFLGQGAF